MPATWLRIPTLTALQRNIIKCSTAYFIASLFTYVPTLSHLISDVTGYGPGGEKSVPSPSAHMVATIAVYFNPAKTAGAMFEADLYCLIALAYAAFLSLGSMSTFWEIDIIPGWEWLADALVVLWLGVGMTFVAWMKVRLAKPTFNTACSMTAIITFVVVVREGGFDTLRQVSFIVFLGSLISNLVCFCVWPQSATANLRANFKKTLDSFAVVLDLVTCDFLDEDDNTAGPDTSFTSTDRRHISHKSLKQAVDAHQASFMGLKRSLDEARMEWLSSTTSSSGIPSPRYNAATAYEDAVNCMNRLAQHLNGLRSCAGLQDEMATIARESKDTNGNGNIPHVSSRNLARWSIADASRNENEGTRLHEHARQAKVDNDVFEELVDELGPSLNALSEKCTHVLERLRDTFASSIPGTIGATVDSNRLSNHGPIGLDEFINLAEDIERALFTFESTSNHAMMRFYRRSDMGTSALNSNRDFVLDGLDGREGEDGDSDGSDTDKKVTESRVTLMDSEAVFLVYFFIFTLQEFAKELTLLVEATYRIYTAEKAVAASGVWSRIGRVFSRFALFLRQNLFSRHLQLGHNKRNAQNKPGLKRRFSSFISPQFPRHAPYFPKVKPHAPNTIQTPARADLPFMGRVKQAIWKVGTKWQNRKVKYAIKAGMALAMLAAPGFIDATRPIFMDFRGEWALISFFVVISPTLGATNFLSLHRILGTILGAITAVFAFTFMEDSPTALALFGYAFSVPCFYYIVSKPQYATSGRFVLLTYNLICLYCYNTRDRDIPVYTVAFRRATSVIVGVVWAGVVARVWWPSEARRELANGLSEFCLNMGWLYTHLVAANSGVPISVAVTETRGVFSERDAQETNRSVVSTGSIRRREYGSRRGNREIRVRVKAPNDDDGDVVERRVPTETTSLLSPTASRKLTNSIQLFMAMELHLQIKLLELQTLLSQTAHEPRLKGPFPIALYREILQSLQTILDKMHSMRCVTTREEWLTDVRRDFVLPVNKERREMVGNVMLYFSVFSSAFKLKAPLPPYLPPAEKSRQRLVSAIRQLPLMHPAARAQLKASRQLLYFAYALTMKGVIRELETLGRTLQDVFGVIGQTREEFERLFEVEGLHEYV